MQPEIDGEEEYFEDLITLARDYNTSIEDTTANLIDADKNLTELLNSSKEMFEEVIKSPRTKFVYAPQIATSIADLLKQKSSIRKDLANIAEKRLLNNLKLREMHKTEKAANNAKSADIDPIALVKALEGAFAKNNNL